MTEHTSSMTTQTKRRSSDVFLSTCSGESRTKVELVFFPAGKNACSTPNCMNQPPKPALGTQRPKPTLVGGVARTWVQRSFPSVIILGSPQRAQVPANDPLWCTADNCELSAGCCSRISSLSERFCVVVVYKLFSLKTDTISHPHHSHTHTTSHPPSTNRAVTLHKAHTNTAVHD